MSIKDVDLDICSQSYEFRWKYRSLIVELYQVGKMGVALYAIIGRKSW